MKDAVCHVARIHRVLSLKRGNLMLVGVGGSGRQSLTRLAAYICGQELFTIEITKNYRQVSVVLSRTHAPIDRDQPHGDNVLCYLWT